VNAVNAGSGPSPSQPVIVKISPMAHLGVGFFTLAAMSLVLAEPRVFTAILILPVIASYAIVRYRTVADRDTVTARRLFSSRTVKWSDIDGLRFDKRSWALACLRDGTSFRLPGVTFATLPELTAASGGRVPNPYQ
jgi:Bacterial PH domain